MKSIIKEFFLAFLVSGLVYAGISAGFDYANHLEFSFGKFILKAFIFGLMMQIMSKIFQKKNKE